MTTYVMHTSVRMKAVKNVWSFAFECISCEIVSKNILRENKPTRSLQYKNKNIYKRNSCKTFTRFRTPIQFAVCTDSYSLIPNDEHALLPLVPALTADQEEHFKANVQRNCMYRAFRSPSKAKLSGSDRSYGGLFYRCHMPEIYRPVYGLKTEVSWCVRFSRHVLYIFFVVAT